jgi:hypothetical protein
MGSAYPRRQRWRPYAVLHPLKGNPPTGFPGLAGYFFIAPCGLEEVVALLSALELLLRRQGVRAEGGVAAALTALAA